MRTTIKKLTKSRAKERAIHIIQESMKDLPGIRWMIGDNPRTQRSKLKALAEYVFELSWKKDGLLLSRDKNGVAILIRQNTKTRSKLYLGCALKFVLNCTGFKRMLEIVKREKYIQSQHPSNGDYLYSWIYAVHPDARGFRASVELKNRVFAESDRTGLPIYLETTVAKNKRVYQRYGFEIYHKWFIEKRGVTMWFMRRNPFTDENQVKI